MHARSLSNPIANLLHPNVSFEKAWFEKLKPALHSIFEQRTSSLSFEELYRHAYQLVNGSKSSALYKHLEHEMNQRSLVISELLSLAPDSSFLDSFVTHCQNYLQSAKLISDIFMYLDRNYISTQPDLDSVYNMCVITLTHVFFPSNPPSFLQQRLSSILEDSFNRARTHWMSDVDISDSSKNAIRILFSLGFNSRTVYLHVIESHFLHATFSFYTQYSSDRLMNVSLADYINDVSRVLTFEESLVKSAVDDVGANASRKVAHQALILDHLDHIFSLDSGPIIWLKVPDQNLKTLNQFYFLIKEEKPALERLTAMVIDFLSSSMSTVFLNFSENFDTNFIMFVESVIHLFNQVFVQILKNSFENDPYVKRSVSDAFEKLSTLTAILTRKTLPLSLYHSVDMLIT
ncbi:hypothetical protein GEMRC1_006793 [Eukaryota sp. GEM-RC1]